MRNFVTFTAVLAIVGLLCGTASADLLAQWKIEQDGSLTSAPVTTVGSGVSSTDLARAATSVEINPGISWPDAVGALADWRLGSSLEWAIDKDNYYGFTITPDSGTTVDFSNLSGLFSVNDGASSADVTFHLLSSQTGFSYDPLGLNVLGALNVTATGTGYNPGVYSASFDLSTASALQGVTSPTEFRIYFSSVDGNRMAIGQAWGLPDDVDLQVDGTATAVPEPTSIALLSAAMLLSVALRRRTQ